jgi:hypothetical protein
MRNLLLSFVVLGFFSAAVFGQCPGNGMVLTFSGDRLGDPWALDLYGSPGLSGLLGVDDTGGPVLTQFGPICLGLTPNLQLLDFTTDAAGHFGMGGLLPPSPSLIGFEAHLQAAAASASAPGGLALSNGATAKLRPPRVFFFNPGYPSPFGTVPGSFCAYDALSDVVFTPAIPLAAAVTDAIMIPALNWLAILLSNGTLVCYDANTVTPTLTLPLLLSPSYPSKLGVEGTTLYVLHYGTSPNPFTSGTPGAVRAYSLPSGTPGFTCQLSSGNPDEMLVLPGTGAAYLRAGSNVIPISLVSGTELPAIPLSSPSGAISEWVLGGTVLYCLMPGVSANPFGGAAIPPALASIDTINHVALQPAPIQLGVPSGPATMLRYGPGTGGFSSLFVYCLNTATPMLEVNPATLTINIALGTSTLVSDMQLSSGGTEWILLVGGGTPSLQTMTPPTLALSQVTPLLPGVSNLTVVPNWTTRRGLLVYNGNVVLPFSTDFSTPPFYTVTLPVSSVSSVVID